MHLYKLNKDSLSIINNKLECLQGEVLVVFPVENNDYTIFVKNSQTSYLEFTFPSDRSCFLIEHKIINIKYTKHNKIVFNLELSEGL